MHLARSVHPSAAWFPVPGCSQWNSATKIPTERLFVGVWYLHASFPANLACLQHQNVPSAVLVSWTEDAPTDSSWALDGVNPNRRAAPMRSWQYVWYNIEDSFWRSVRGGKIASPFWFCLRNFPSSTKFPILNLLKWHILHSRPSLNHTCCPSQCGDLAADFSRSFSLQFAVVMVSWGDLAGESIQESGCRGWRGCRGCLVIPKSIELGRCHGSREAWDGHASDSRGVLPLSGGNAWKMPAVVSTGGAAEVINGDNLVQRCTEGTCPQELG